MAYTVFLSAGISFAVVMFLTPWLIRYLRRIDLVVKDMNKEELPLVPISGGLSVMAGFFLGLMAFIFFRTFFPDKGAALLLHNGNLTMIFAAAISILLISIVGFMDDLIIKKGHESSAGLKQWQKPMLTLSAAIPLMVINAGTTTVGIPFVGEVNLGLIYPMLVIPIGVVGAANMVNMLAGFNGLEVGLGIISTGMLGLYAYANKSYLGALIALMAFSALLAFYYYNKFPARILPGDSLTYLLGGILASIAIIGNIERAVLIVSSLFFIEFLLKLRCRFKANSYGYYKDGKIHCNYSKIYSVPHILTMTGKFNEKQVVYIILIAQLIVSSLIWFI